MSKKRWLAVYVKMHHEKKTRDRLNAMGIFNFLPLKNELRQWSDRKKEIETVLIPMMIFVYVDAQEQKVVLNMPSAIKYLTLRGESKPAVIPSAQMDMFMFLTEKADTPVSFTFDAISPGDRVNVLEGPLSGLSGEFVLMNGKSNVVLRIPQLGCAMVEVGVDKVEPLCGLKTQKDV